MSSKKTLVDRLGVMGAEVYDGGPEVLDEARCQGPLGGPRSALPSPPEGRRTRVAPFYDLDKASASCSLNSDAGHITASAGWRSRAEPKAMV